MAKRRTAKKKKTKKVAKRPAGKRAKRVSSVRSPKKRARKRAVKASRKAARPSSRKVARKAPRAPKPIATPAPRAESTPPTFPTAPPRVQPAPVTSSFSSPSVPPASGTGESYDNGDDSEPILRTYLTAKQLQEFRQLLLQKRSEIVGDVTNLTNEALNRQRDGGGDHSSMPIHMADLGTDNWEQEFTLGLAESERALLRELDEALDRIEKRTYGICQATKKPIGLERLRAQPWTRYSIEYARERDEGRRR